MYALSEYLIKATAPCYVSPVLAHVVSYACMFLFSLIILILSWRHNMQMGFLYPPDAIIDNNSLDTCIIYIWGSRGIAGHQAF